MNTFNNKVALITGGSRGIGASVALKLASLGCNIALNYNNNFLLHYILNHLSFFLNYMMLMLYLYPKIYHHNLFLIFPSNFQIHSYLKNRLLLMMHL